MSTSDYVAWYGALLASTIFIWDLCKWIHSGSRIKITVTYNMQISEDSGALDPNKYIVVSAVNKGDAATTVSHLGIEFYESRFQLLFRRPTTRMIVPSPTHAQPLPKLINPGETWTGAIHQTDELNQMISKGHICCSLLNNSKGKSESGRLIAK